MVLVAAAHRQAASPLLHQAFARVTLARAPRTTRCSRCGALFPSAGRRHVNSTARTASSSMTAPDVCRVWLEPSPVTHDHVWLSCHKSTMPACDRCPRIRSGHGLGGMTRKCRRTALSRCSATTSWLTILHSGTRSSTRIAQKNIWCEQGFFRTVNFFSRNSGVSALINTPCSVTQTTTLDNAHLTHD